MRDTVRGKLQNNVKKISRPNFPDKAFSLLHIILIISAVKMIKIDLYDRKAPLDAKGLALSPLKSPRVNKLQSKRNPILPSNINIKIHIISIAGSNIRTNIYEENLQNFVCAYSAGLQNMTECFCSIRIEIQMQYP